MLATYTSGPCDGPVLIAFHGVTDSAPSLAGIAQHFSDKWRVMLVDSLGHGLSRRFDESELADPLSACVAEAIEVVQEAARKAGSPVVLAGHSMGGAIATGVAIKRPDLLRGLILEDPAWLTPDRAAAYKEGVQEELARLEATTVDPAAGISWLRVTKPERIATEIGSWASAKSQVDRALIATGIVGYTADRHELASRILVPTLMLTGTEDGVIISPQALHELAQNHECVTGVVVEGAGHNVRRERPAHYYQAVEAFLSSL